MQYVHVGKIFLKNILKSKVTPPLLKTVRLINGAAAGQRGLTPKFFIAFLIENNQLITIVFGK